MDGSTLVILLIVTVELAYGGLLIGMIVIARRRRKTRWPFDETLKLLRSPGESLKRRLAKMDEDFMVEFFSVCVTIIILLPCSAWVGKRIGLTGWPSLVFLVVPSLVVSAFSSWRFVGRWKERTEYFLGWFGERVTAEHLRPLHLHGYRVFHDVPCKSGENGFNIDHAVVGPSGVWVVETKTRRKGNARPGLKDHEVTFDGQRLNWPSGYDQKAVEQTINEADWLRKWIKETTGWDVAVRCVVSIPGWYVRESPSKLIRVVNPKVLPAVVEGRGPAVLTEQQIDQISRQLEIRCRDVAD
jgi:hypothetical protein